MRIALMVLRKIQTLAFVHREKALLSHIFSLALMSLTKERNGVLHYSIPSFIGNYSQKMNCK